jgi:hypothetical protein
VVAANQLRQHVVTGGGVRTSVAHHDTEHSSRYAATQNSGAQQGGVVHPRPYIAMPMTFLQCFVQRLDHTTYFLFYIFIIDSSGEVYNFKKGNVFKCPVTLTRPRTPTERIYKH